MAHEAATRRIRRLSLDDAWASLAVLLPVGVTLLSRMHVIDLGYQLRAGKEFWASGRIADSETWTFTAAGSEWVNQQWAAEALLAGLYRGGWAALAAGRGLLVGITMTFIFLACRSRGARVRDASLLTIAGFFVAQVTIAMRAQMLVVPLFAMALWAAASRREHPRRLWLIPAATVLAANLHGSVLLFPLVAGLVVAEDLLERAPARRGVAILSASLLGTLLSPFGVDVWSYVIDLSTNPIIRDIVREWAPVTTDNLSGWLMLGSALPIVVLLARRRSPVPWADLLWLGAFFVFAMTAVRGLLWWGLVAPVVVAGLLPERGDERRAEPSLAATVMVAGMLALVIVALPWWREDAELLDRAPPGVATAVASLGDGARVIAPQYWGSWLEIATPGARPFVDSRIELFPRGIWEDYGEVAFAGSDWREVLDRWEPDAVVLESGWPLVPELRDDPAWRVLHEDDDGLVFVPA